MSRRCSIKVCCAGFCIVDSPYGAAESGHVQVAAGGPVVGGDLPDLAVMGIKALPSSGKLPTTRALLRVSRFSRPNHGVRADAPAMLHRIAFQQACGGLAGQQVNASPTPCDQGSDEVPPVGRILLHTLGHADHLPVTVPPDAWRRPPEPCRSGPARALPLAFPASSKEKVNVLSLTQPGFGLLTR